MRIGFLGFGEAGYLFSKGLLANTSVGVVAYDCNSQDGKLGGLIRTRANEVGVRLLGSNAELTAGTDLILSVVTAASAVQAADQTASSLRPGQVFCDCNSVSPSSKRSIAELVERKHASFVEAAIMAPVDSRLDRVPILMNGTEAPRVAAFLASFGMKIQVMIDSIGSAAAVKMCRSIVIKGLEALLLESMATAEHFHCRDAVLRSLNESNPDFKWDELSQYMIARVFQHGVRRSAEMREVAAMQLEAGIPAVMSGAAAQIQDWRALVPKDGIDTPSDLISALARAGEAGQKSFSL